MPTTRSLTRAVTFSAKPAVALKTDELVSSDEIGSQGQRAILALALPDRQHRLSELQIPGGPVVVDHVADDVVLRLLGCQVGTTGPDDRSDFELEVKPRATRRHIDVFVGPQDRCGTGEVERRDLVPPVVQSPVPPGSDLAVAHVLEKAQEVTDRRRFRDRGPQHNVVERNDHVGLRQRVFAHFTQGLRTTADQVNQVDAGVQRVNVAVAQYAYAVGAVKVERHPAHQHSICHLSFSMSVNIRCHNRAVNMR